MSLGPLEGLCGLEYRPSRCVGVPCPDCPRFREGDRCTGCGCWYWNDDRWHTLVPKMWAHREHTARPVQCGLCRETEGRPGVWV